MLFLLTGEVQIGKTRWLESLVAELGAFGVPCAGRACSRAVGALDGAARRCERLREAGHRQRSSARGRARSLRPARRLGPGRRHLRRREPSGEGGAAWHIDDAAIDRVNAHFDEITAHASAAAPVGAKPHSERSAEGAESKDPSRAPGLLIVDELGRLEIWRGGGLTSAMALLAQGPTPVFPHALAVVRDYLLDDTEALLAEAWPDRCRISPDDTGRAVILSACEFGA